MNAELERQWLHSLLLRWEHINLALLDGQLSAPQFVLDESRARLGRWEAKTRTIGISRHHLTEHTWAEIEDTLKHEMAHQVVSELFSAELAKPHGELFGRACRMLGMDRSPQADEQVAPEHIRVLERVTKLLNLSTSQNPHEAQAAILAANRLLLRHNLDMADANQKSDVSWRFLGRASGRISLAQKLIAGILQEFFFVRCVWVSTHDVNFRPVRKLEIFGRHHGLDLAEYVHNFLETSLNRLWKSYSKNTGAKGAALKNEYVVGVLSGLREQLNNQRKVHIEQGLVWLGDPAVDELIQHRHGHLRRGRGGRYRVGRAHQAGREAGLKLQIRPGVGEKTTTARGHLLK